MNRYFEGGSPLVESEFEVLDKTKDDIDIFVPDDGLILECDPSVYLAKSTLLHTPHFHFVYPRAADRSLSAENEL